MSDVLNFLFGFAVLVFLGYVLIFGGIGALLARHRGGTGAMGFIVGLIPVVGWFAVLFITREATRSVSGSEIFGTLVDSPALTPSPTELTLPSDDPHVY